jgi:glycosyltransferase involved in cell wall biosynthesis
MKPEISVIISTFNRGGGNGLLQRAIDSVLTQTFKNFELIIVDDHSDQPPAFTLPDGENRVIAVRLPWNTGYQVRPKNVGIMCSRGKYIAYLDDDNVFLPNHLEVLYKAITEKQADVVYGDRVYKSTVPDEKRFMGKMSYDYDLKKINMGNYIDTSDIMHTIQSINDIGYWDIFWERKADWLLMTRFGKKGMRIIHVPEILTEYWWTDSNIGTPLVK